MKTAVFLVSITSPPPCSILHRSNIDYVGYHCAYPLQFVCACVYVCVYVYLAPYENSSVSCFHYIPPYVPRFDKTQIINVKSLERLDRLVTGQYCPILNKFESQNGNIEIEDITESLKNRFDCK